MHRPDLIIYAKTIECEALKQIERLVSYEAFSRAKVRIMPDVHAGKGCVIGFTADLHEKVIPNVVGVDIGCGMLTLSLGSPDIDLKKLDGTIQKRVPAGWSIHPSPIAAFPALGDLRCAASLKNTDRFAKSIGTLGGGNHFIEVDRASDGTLYLVIHTGSRNLGKQVADIYQHIAIKRRPNVPGDLAYLTGADRDDYLHDMRICQRYASENRRTIATLILKEMGLTPLEDFETIHNYIDFSDNIVRKGAISAKKGERVLIPLNMRDGALLCIGKGNAAWNCSAPHGAGRLMSRGDARRSLNMEDYRDAMQGIYSSSISKRTLDEAPMAYKPPDEIIRMIGDTVDIIDAIKPIYNFKAAE